MSFMDLFKLPGHAPKAALTKDQVAGLLRVSPEALARFEESYRKALLSVEEDDFFQINSRQASAAVRTVDPSKAPAGPVDGDLLGDVTRKIVSDLLAQTEVYVFDGDLSAEPEYERVRFLPAAPAASMEITNELLRGLPEAYRPQLTGDMVRKDVGEDASGTLLYMYARSMDEGLSAKQRRKAYHMFRQGLDILDLDPLTYEIIDTNPASMGHWLPRLVDACRGQDFFRIPATRVAKVPLTLLQLTRLDYASLTRTTLDVVDRWAAQAFELDQSRSYFIKTGTYSSKFDFRNAKVTGAKEVRELGEYLLFIHHQALQMASPLSVPCIYGASTTNEWVVREFVEDAEKNPCIYKGLPLRTEYRVFVDCDTDRVIGCAPYWEPETMKRRFGHGPDAGSPHQIHDYVVYKAHEDVLMGRYEENRQAVVDAVQAILPRLDLPGQWSVDVMQNGGGFWLIDMAPAGTSAYYSEYVPAELRRAFKEDWLPRLPDTEKEETE